MKETNDAAFVGPIVVCDACDEEINGCGNALWFDDSDTICPRDGSLPIVRSDVA